MNSDLAELMEERWGERGEEKEQELIQQIKCLFFSQSESLDGYGPQRQ